MTEGRAIESQGHQRCMDAKITGWKGAPVAFTAAASAALPLLPARAAPFLARVPYVVATSLAAVKLGVPVSRINAASQVGTQQ